MNTAWRIIACCLVISACGSTGEVTNKPVGDVTQDIFADGGADLVPVPDAVVGLDIPDLLPRFEVGDTGPDLPAQQCLPGEGCFLDGCAENSDCQSGWCVQHLGESVCSQACQEECPPGWSCQQVAGTDPDVVYICVSKYANLCRPCSGNADCMSTGGAQDACLEYGPDGDFCGGSCGAAGECPWGFTCSEIESVDGATLQQCVNDTGECPCTANSVALGLATDCVIANDFGVCGGTRICLEGGLSDCDSATPAAESCNGLDDDCDGEVDEPDLVDGAYLPLCGDDNSCTSDKCVGEEGCVNEILGSGDCSDQNPCTVADHCDGGECVGDPVQCDDENPCTDNVCTDTGGCEYPAVGGTCDDDNACTVGDQCQAADCLGTQVSCDCQADEDCEELEDGDLCNGTLFCDKSALPYQCRVEEETLVDCPPAEGLGAICLMADCTPDTGACGHLSANDGLLCDDGDACTSGSVCGNGECDAGVAVNCNDGNPCTDDTCDAETGCAHTPNADPCNDGDACTAGDACDGGVCMGGPGVICDDGNACNGTESCDQATGCQPGEFLICDDGDLCNGAESCNPDSGCVAGLELVCDDGNSCNGTESCDQATGCQPGEFLICSDGDLCNGVETCAPESGCTPGIQLVCHDGNPCTNDSCDAEAGCLFTANDGVCDDGNMCTVGESCAEGICGGGAAMACDDENLCTDDVCDTKFGCTHLLNFAPCNDDDLCTTGDHCALGDCIGGGELPCNDGNACTDDQCDAVAGCQFVPNDGPCDDGSECTTGDHCQAGQCVITAFVGCDDGNPCTDDTCDIELGCVHLANAIPCDDGTVCTVGDTCADKLCVPGAPLVCNDANLCTTDSCDAALGCLFVNNSVNCDDSDLCTPFDKCQGGECVGSGVVDCDDANLCTDDSCAPDSGCVNTANALACDDGDECTTSDGCANKTCVGGPALDCDDAQACTTDACDVDTGCTHVPLPDNTGCGGENVCLSGECVSPCVPGSKTFSYTGGQQTFAVPSGCEEVTVVALGGKGGCSQGGNGGRATGVVPVTSGETLYVYVGGQGQCNSAVKSGAYNGGGATVPSNGYTNGEGGGASDVRRGGSGLGNRVLVAGAGGGRGWGGNAGHGGGLTGQAGNTSGGGCSGSCAGKGGSQNAGGEGGKCGGSCWGTNGTLGKGGTAAACSASGGGGGGGLYGGGGGGHCSGGGGSSFFGPGVQIKANDQGVNASTGNIVISW